MAKRAALCGFLCALFLSVASEARADCDSMLGDALGAFPCLVCPCFLVPAVCCASFADTPEFWDAVNGGCICFLCVGIDGPIVSASTGAELPAPAATQQAIAY